MNLAQSKPMSKHPILIDGTTLTSSQINFLKETRLPKITMMDEHDISLLIIMEAQKDIEITLQSKFHGQEPEVITISKGNLFSLAEIKTKEKDLRLVRLVYQKSGINPVSVQTTITWKYFLYLKRNNYILPFEVYKS